MKKVELLSPAGNMETLKAVILAGCDAVYIGGYMFGARTFADNFSNEEIIEAIKYAHLYGVKVYVTVNTLIYEDEMDTCINYVDFLHRNNVDALIIQDLGLFDLIRKVYPNLEIHASTQMHIHNLEGVKLLEKLGMKRVVLARETSIDIVKSIIKNTNIEIECFIHGALCVSYSGQCLMSSLIGNRSGNRGSCAGCCREKYSLISNDQKLNKEEFLLSMKDLCTIKDIGKLIDVGISSLKIEGRTKRKEYSYLVTKMYRKAIDNYYKYGETLITNKDIKDLQTIYSRGFTSGYILNSSDVINQYRPNHMGIKVGEVIEVNQNSVKVKLIDSIHRLDGIRFVEDDIGLTLQTLRLNGKRVEDALKNDTIEIDIKGIKNGSTLVKTTDYLKMKEISDEINSLKRKVSIGCSGYIKKDKTIELTFTAGINSVTTTSNYVVQASVNSEVSFERVKQCLAKLGNTIYEINEFNIEVDNNIFIPIGIINDLRRTLVEKLNSKRLYNIKYLKKDYSIDIPDFKKEKNVDYLISINDLNKIKNKEYNKLFTYEDSKYIKKLNNVINDYKEYNEALVSELGSINYYNNFYTDYTFNITNSYGVAFLHSLGSKMVTLSLELDDERTQLIIDNYKKRYNKSPNIEVIVYGRELVMTSKFNLLKYYNVDDGYLVDKFNNKYPLKIEDDLLKVYNYKIRDIKDYDKYYVMGINNIRFNI